jgi:hypothetical protein
MAADQFKQRRKPRARMTAKMKNVGRVFSSNLDFFGIGETAIARKTA